MAIIGSTKLRFGRPILPVFGSVAAAAFAFDPAKKSASITLSSANQTATETAGGSYVCALALSALSIGQETAFTIGPAVASNSPGVGIGNASTVFSAELGSTTNSICAFLNGDVELAGAIIGNVGFTFTAGDVIRVKPVSATQVQWSKNGGAYSASFTHAIPGAIYAGVTLVNNQSITGA